MPKGRKRVKKEATTRKAAEQITFKPQGKGPCKRMPKTIAEQQQLTNEQCFEPAKILAQQHKVGVLQFLVRWKGCSNAYDSWEPLVNIPGSEDLIRDYRAERAEKEAKDEAKRNEAKRKRQEAETQQPEDATASLPDSDAAPSDEGAAAIVNPKRSLP